MLFLKMGLEPYSKCFAIRKFIPEIISQELQDILKTVLRLKKRQNKKLQNHF